MGEGTILAQLGELLGVGWLVDLSIPSLESHHWLSIVGFLVLCGTAAYFAVAFTALYWLFRALRIHASATSASGAHPSLWARTAPLWTSQWHLKIIAFAVAFVCSRHNHAAFLLLLDLRA